MTTTATIKSMADIALCLGLTIQLEGHYKGKAVNKTISLVKKEGYRLLDLWGERLNQREVKKIEKKILRLEPWLDKKPASVHTSVALGIISDAKSFWKGKKRKQAETFETRLFSLHKRIDYKYSKTKTDFDSYDDANKVVKIWKAH